MTTTAAAWRHVKQSRQYAASVCIDRSSESDPFCGCFEPTPDPASPCGYEGCPLRGRAGHCDDPAEDCARDHAPREDAHPHQPTRCTCGHALEAVR